MNCLIFILQLLCWCLNCALLMNLRRCNTISRASTCFNVLSDFSAINYNVYSAFLLISIWADVCMIEFLFACGASFVWVSFIVVYERLIYPIWLGDSGYLDWALALLAIVTLSSVCLEFFLAVMVRGGSRIWILWVPIMTLIYIYINNLVQSQILVDI